MKGIILGIIGIAICIIN